MKLRTKEWISCAHILLDYKGKCSRLHGHNWEIDVTVNGIVDAKTGMVIDFSKIKSIIRELDHKMLVPSKSPYVKTEGGLSPNHRTEVCILVNDKKYIFPYDDCFYIPTTQITAENLAEYLAREIDMNVDDAVNVTVKVSETVNNSAEESL